MALPSLGLLVNGKLEAEVLPFLPRGEISLVEEKTGFSGPVDDCQILECRPVSIMDDIICKGPKGRKPESAANEK